MAIKIKKVPGLIVREVTLEDWLEVLSIGVLLQNQKYVVIHEKSGTPIYYNPKEELAVRMAGLIGEFADWTLSIEELQQDREITQRLAEACALIALEQGKSEINWYSPQRGPVRYKVEDIFDTVQKGEKGEPDHPKREPRKPD